MIFLIPFQMLSQVYQRSFVVPRDMDKEVLSASSQVYLQRIQPGVKWDQRKAVKISGRTLYAHSSIQSGVASAQRVYPESDPRW